MSLRDEILKQRGETELQEQRAEQEKTQSNTQKFLNIKANLENGVVPKDWLDWYEKYIGLIKKELATSDSFAVTEDVSEEYYFEKQNCGNGAENELTLMNKYLTQRLTDEGFKRVRFELIEETEEFMTEYDYERQQQEQAEADRRNQEKYENELRNTYYSDAYGGGYTSRNPTKEYTYVKGIATGKRKVYKIIVKCSLYEIKKSEPTPNSEGNTYNYKSTAKKSKRRKELSATVKISIAGSVGAACALAFGIYCYLNAMLAIWYLPILAAGGFLLISSFGFFWKELLDGWGKYKLVIWSIVFLAAITGLVIIALLAFNPNLFNP